jgi:hypothetical protein
MSRQNSGNRLDNDIVNCRTMDGYVDYTKILDNLDMVNDFTSTRKHRQTGLGSNSILKTSIDYQDELGSRIISLLLRDFTRLLDNYLDQKLSIKMGLENFNPQSIKFELSELILTKVKMLMASIEEGDLKKWLGSLSTGSNNILEREYFTKIKKLFERIKFIAGGSEETTINRKELRQMSTLIIEVNLYSILFLFLIMFRTQA